MGNEYHIEVAIQKNIIGIDSEKITMKVPDTILFLIIVDPSYPEKPPKVLTKSNFCQPSLMDGRDLFNNIFENWTPNNNLRQIIEKLVPFLYKVINTNKYKFYGKFHVGATYNLKNFEHMIVGKYKNI